MMVSHELFEYLYTISKNNVVHPDCKVQQYIICSGQFFISLQIQNYKMLFVLNFQYVAFSTVGLILLL